MRHLTKNIGLRLSGSDYRLLKAVAKARGMSVGAFVRQAVRTELARLSYLDNSTKKALGVQAGEVK
jgi:uncharacterized protein (DUF1778 family)